MKQYIYKLEKGSKKHLCPGCGKKSFVRYQDTEEQNYIPEQYGRCDRESKCGYHINPYNDGYANRDSEQRDYNEARQKQYARAREAKKEKTDVPVYIPNEIFNQTLKNYEQNIFIQNLLKNIPFPFEEEHISKVISMYYLGTVSNGYRAGAITFPFIDFDGNVRAIQVKQFDENNHTIGTDFLHSIIQKHNNKNNLPHPDWLPKYIAQDKRISCLFGEHLLKRYPLNPIALVEAPKTAVYGSLYFGLPNNQNNFIWLAVYNKSSFTFDKLKALKGRDVFVFPDLSKDGGTFKEWKQKAEVIENQLPETRFIFSDLLEQFSPQDNRNDGYDIADFLIKLDWRNFRAKEYNNENEQELPTIEQSEKSEKDEHLETTFFHQSEQFHEQDNINDFITKEIPNWNTEIDDLEAFFTSPLPPIQPLSSNHYIISDMDKMIKSHLRIVKSNNGNPVYRPYIDRIQELKHSIIKQLTANSKVS